MQTTYMVAENINLVQLEICIVTKFPQIVCHLGVAEYKYISFTVYLM